MEIVVAGSLGEIVSFLPGCKAQVSLLITVNLRYLYLEVNLADGTLAAGKVVISKTLPGILYQLIDHRTSQQLLTLHSQTFTDAIYR